MCRLRPQRMLLRKPVSAQVSKDCVHREDSDDLLYAIGIKMEVSMICTNEKRLHCTVVILFLTDTLANFV